MLRQLVLAAAVAMAAIWPHVSGAQVSRTLTGISLRGEVNGAATGAAMLATNFTVEGTATKSVLLRAVGPTLGVFGVAGVLTDPVLRVYDATGALVGSNSGWGGNPAVSAAMMEVGAFPLSTTSKDAALLLTLAAGTYTATVGSTSGGSGTVLLEVYDAQTTGRLAYTAIRHQVGGGNGVMTSGFVVAAGTSATVLIRGLGPALTAAGVTGALANPTLTLSSGSNGAPVATNDNWGNAASLSDAAATAGLMPLASGSNDAAILTTLPAGPYLVQLSGVNGGTGVGTIEVVQIDANRATSFAPAILVPPRDITLSAGASLTLAAPVVGKPAVSYQWRKNGTAIAGATASSFAINAAQASDAGAYTVALTNAAGTTIATAGTITLTNSVAIVTQPSAQSVALGGTATFSVTAVGSPAPSYQWLFNGNPINGATQATLTLTNVTAAQAGFYSVRVSNSASMVTSAAAALEVRTGVLTIVTQPVSQTVTSGGSATFSVVAAGTPPLTYQWLRDGTTISGATQSSFTIAQASMNTAATYVVRVTDINGNLTSSGATLTVRPRPVAGGYFGVLGSGGQFGLLVRADGTGVFLGYANGTRQGLIARDVRVDAARRFEFVATALGGMGAAQYTVTGRITDDGLLQASIAGLTSSVSAVTSGGAATPGNVGFYEGGTPGGSARSYALAGAQGEVMLVTIDGSVVEGGRGAVGVDGSVLIVNETGARTTGSLQGVVLSLVTTPFGGGAARTYQVANSDTRTDVERLVNISTRSQTGAGAAALIAGFVVTGERVKPMLVRAVGPTLSSFGVANPLSAVRLEVYRGQTLVTTGLDWSAAPNASEIAAAATRVSAFALPTGSRDAALLLGLEPGAYTAIVSGQTESATGVSLVEVYDASVGATKDERIVNIATRGMVGTGDQTLIAGFVITGQVPKRVLVRGVGPTLASSFGVSGVLAQPRVTVLTGTVNPVEIATNARWSLQSDAQELAAAAQAAGAFPLAAGSDDAALIVNLVPGTYSAQVTNAAGGSGGGVALVEVYELK